MAISNILIDPINKYPVFKPNQVLTDDQLNNITEFLDEQNRLTRVLLLGTGIACGLEPFWANNALNVSAGFGLTSDGYLIQEPGSQFNRYLDIDIPIAWFGFKPDPMLPNSFKAVELHDTDLLPSEDDDEGGTSPLTDKDKLKDKILIYLLELNTEDDQGLCHNDCDGGRGTRQFTIHKLLFSEEDALSILAKTYEVNKTGAAELQDKFYHKYFMPHLAVPRFGYEKNAAGANLCVQLNNITDYTIFRKKYAVILKKHAAELSTALQQAHQIFSPVLTPEETKTTALIIPQALLNKINDEAYDILETQYLYDYLNDLTDAYNEFVEAAFDLLADCNFHPKHFPNHLILRKFNTNGDPETEPYSVFHSPFTQPPIYNGNQSRLNEVRTLFNRLTHLAGSDTTPSVVGADEIRITPGKSFRAPLSERAVPYYYPSTMLNTWNPRRNRFNRTGQVYSYHRPTKLPYRDPLVYEMEGSDFFRIEGHIGRDFWQVMASLNSLQTKYNLPFNVIALKIGDTFNNELFQFECENLECEKDQLRDKYLLIKQNFDNEVFKNLPTDQQQTLVKAGLLETITGKLDDLNYEAFDTIYKIYEKKTFLKNQVQVQIIDTNLIDKIVTGFLDPKDKLPFQQIEECYQDIQEKIDKTKNRHLFHHFANDYPGLDHKGGVPVGGTFILAYVEPRVIPNKISQLVEVLTNKVVSTVVEQSRIVVADFFLPYSCCSNCPPICYVVARPKPVFILSPNVFCLHDTTEYELTIVAHPGGGTVTGQGYSFHDGKHWFRPSNAGTPDANSQVKLYYSVDGTLAEAVISLVPPPNPEFEMKYGNTAIDGKSICEGEGPVLLNPVVAGGKFFAMVKGQETELAANSFDSASVVVATGAPEQVSIRRLMEGNYCDSQLVKTFTIQPAPDPTFNFAGGKTQVCKDDPSVELIPAELPGEHEFIARISGTQVGIISSDQGKWFLNQSSITLAPGNSVVVNVEHQITTNEGCVATASLPIQVFAKPNPGFSIAGEITQICRTAAAVDLTPVTPGGTFKAILQGVEKPAIVNNNKFDPKLLGLTGNNTVDVIIRYDVNVNNVCPAFHTKTLRVTPPPVAGFNFALLIINDPNSETVQANVTGITPQGAAKYIWASNPQQLTPPNLPATTSSPFTISYEAGPDLMPITLELIVESGGCLSTPMTKKLMPLIQRFEMIAVILDPNGNIHEIEIGPIHNGAKFTPDMLKNAQSFNIRAVSFPYEVHHVELSLVDELGNQRKHTSSTPKNYRLIEGTDKLVPVENLSYTIQAIPFTGSNEAGKELAIEFSIFFGEFIDVARQPEPADEPSEATINFLRKRDNGYRTEIKKLGDNDDLAKTEAFQLAAAFTNFQGSVEEFNERYSAATGSLTAAAGKAKKGTPLHTRFLSLMAITTQYFMDKQVFQEPKKLSAKTTKTLKDQLAAIKKAGVKIAQLKTAWNGNALKKQLSAPAVDAIQKLLK